MIKKFNEWFFDHHFQKEFTLALQFIVAENFSGFFSVNTTFMVNSKGDDTSLLG